MTAPSVAAYRFAVACLYGMGVGALYGFLRPLRPRYTGFADMLTVFALLAAWLQLSFQVCQADLRLGYTAGIFCGAILWEITAGRLLLSLLSLRLLSLGCSLCLFRLPCSLSLPTLALLLSRLGTLSTLSLLIGSLEGLGRLLH